MYPTHCINTFNLCFILQNIFPTSKESLYETIPSSYDLQKDSCLKNSANEEPLKKHAEKPEKPEVDNKSMIESVKAIARLYRNPVFVLICVCMATYVLIFIPIMTSIVDYSKDKGLPETIGKYLIHAMAVGDIAGKYELPWKTRFLNYFKISTFTLSYLHEMNLPKSLNSVSLNVFGVFLVWKEKFAAITFQNLL